MLCGECGHAPHVGPCLGLSPLFESGLEQGISVPFEEDYTCPSASMEDVFHYLDAQRRNGYNSLCDITLKADGESFYAHKCILGAKSEYFRSMFKVDSFSESSSKEVELQLISADALGRILDMIYTGKLKLDIESIYDTVAASDLMMFSEVKTFCEHFLTQIITTSQFRLVKSMDNKRAVKEALKIKRSAMMYHMGELAVLAEKFISKYFEIISATDDFLEMSLQEVCDLMESDQMQVSHEHVLWKAAMRWLEHAETGSCFTSSSDVLMKAIRFPLMEPKFLLNTVRQHSLMSSTKCQQYIQQAMEYHLLPEERSLKQTSQTKPRCTINTTIIYCLAGATHFLCFLPHKNQWFSLQAPLQSDLQDDQTLPSTSLSIDNSIAKNNQANSTDEETFYGLLSVSGNVFIRVLSRSREQVGSFTLRRLQMFSIASNTWTECSLPEHVHFAILIECNMVLYSCSRKGIEAYSPERDQWTLMQAATLSPCQFVVSDGKCIYLNNLEDGRVEIINTDNQFQITQNQMTSLSHFDVLSLAKLNNFDVFLSLRTSAGIIRKIVNIRTNRWQDANKRMCHGASQVTPKHGVSYPHCLNLEDPWEIVFDRNKNEMFVLAKWSAIADCPSPPKSKSGSDSPVKQLDAVLPFFKIDESRAWRRQAALPEALVAGGLVTSGGTARQTVHMCISDGMSSMATSLP